MSSTALRVPISKNGEPFWAIAELFPSQGEWTEEEYLALETNKLIEFDNGILEILPMPNFIHQAMAIFLVRLLQDFLGDTGNVASAPFRMKLPNGKYREPDVLVVLNENMTKFGVEYWTGADLVVEIVSPGGEDRDFVKKRADYAVTGIPEYWIVDPRNHKVTVLKLNGQKYVEHGMFKRGQRATSALLKGFEVDVSALFAAGKPRK